MYKDKEELIQKLRFELEKKLQDDNVNDKEKENLQNLLNVKADSFNEESFLGIYKSEQPFFYWTFKIVIILGTLICLFNIINQIL